MLEPCRARLRNTLSAMASTRRSLFGLSALLADGQTAARAYMRFTSSRIRQSRCLCRRATSGFRVALAQGDIAPMRVALPPLACRRDASAVPSCLCREPSPVPSAPGCAPELSLGWQLSAALQFQLALAANRNLNVFTNVNLPLAPPPLGLFENRQFILFISQGPNNFVRQITASPIETVRLVPEPGTLMLLGAGIVGFAAHLPVVRNGEEGA
jgi:PEP-CTERM motif